MTYENIYNYIKQLKKNDPKNWQKCLKIALYLFEHSDNKEVINWCYDILILRKNIVVMKTNEPSSLKTWHYLRELMIIYEAFLFTKI